MKKLLYVLLFILCCGVQLRSQNPNTAKFPGAVATDQDLFVAKNVARPSVALTSGVDNVTLTLPVTDGTKFRQYQIIGVDLELMQVCSTAALSVTACSRGLGGTTAAVHSNGAVVIFPFADVQINQLAAEIKAIEGAIVNGPLLVAKTTNDGSGAKLQVNGGATVSGTTSLGGLARDVIPSPMQGNYSGAAFYTDGHLRNTTITRTDPDPGNWSVTVGNLDVTNLNPAADAALDQYPSAYAHTQYVQSEPTSTKKFDGELIARNYETYSGANAGGFIPASVSGTLDLTSVNDGTLNRILGTWAEGRKLGSGQADYIYGASFGAGVYNTSSTLNVKALDLGTSVRQTSSATNAYGLNINSLYTDGTSSITNAYGLYIGDWAGFGSTASYNIFSAGATSKNKFEGDVRAGTFSVSKNNSLDRTFFSLKVNETDRWNIGLHGSEFGSNGGSGLSFWSYGDTGTYIGAPLQLRRTGAVLLNTDTDDGVNKLQVQGGGIWTDKPFSSGASTAKARFGDTAGNVPRADFSFNTSFSNPNWNRDDTSKSASLLAMWDGHADFYVAAAGSNPITWTTGFTILPNGEVSIPKRHQQINFTMYDANVALAAATIPGLWRAEYGAATVTKVSCAANTADAVIQIKKNTGTNVLSANLTCSNAGWANTTTFANASLASGDDLGLQIISGTAQRINVSIQYTGN